MGVEDGTMQTPEAHWPGILTVYLVSFRPVTTLSQKLKCLEPEKYHLRLSCSLHMHPDIHVPYTYRHPIHMNAGTHMHANLHVHDYIHMHTSTHTCRCMQHSMLPGVWPMPGISALWRRRQKNQDVKDSHNYIATLRLAWSI